MIYDISYCQRGLDLRTLTNCEFVIIRIGVRDHIDSEAIGFIEQCIKYHIPYHMYWYLMAENVTKAAEEAGHTSRIVEYVKTTLNQTFAENRLWIDIEENDTVNSKDADNIINTYFNKLKVPRELAIKPVGVYSYYAALVDQLKDVQSVKGRPLWVAWFKDTKTVRDTIIKTLPTAKIWQAGSKRVGNHVVDYDYKLC